MNDTTHGFNFLIDQEPSLAIRLIRELSIQAHEFRSSPGAYLKSSFASDIVGRKRTRLLMFGMLIGMIFLSSLMMVTMLFYYSQAKRITAGADAKPNIFPLFYPSGLLPIPVKRTGEREQGGGTSGGGELLPPSFGAPPPGSLTPTITAASTHPIPNPNPVLPVMPTVLAPALPDQPGNLQFGVPNGPLGPPSNGPGEGGGIGTDKGTGNGSGHGPGDGPGRDGGRGNGPNNGQIGTGGESETPYSARLVILSKPRPDYTEQARTQKIQGQVLIEAVFRADGRITNVQIIRGLGYGLDEKAIAAVMQIKFKPAERNNRPTDAKQRIFVTFQLL